MARPSSNEARDSWQHIGDLAERRRVQNRIAQRNRRKSR
jgi:hypothetical protein